MTGMSCAHELIKLCSILDELCGHEVASLATMALRGTPAVERYALRTQNVGVQRAVLQCSAVSSSGE